MPATLSVVAYGTLGGRKHCSHSKGVWLKSERLSESKELSITVIAASDEPVDKTVPLPNYRGESRCVTFTRYPALASSFFTSSPIKTDRCWPPVQPNPMVR